VTGAPGRVLSHYRRSFSRSFRAQARAKRRRSDDGASELLSGLVQLQLLHYAAEGDPQPNFNTADWMSSASSTPSNERDRTTRPAASGTASEVFRVFLQLGLTSFGGPIAHLGYFRDELVVRRKWIDEAGYADLVALCQFLPGPASSQVGYALGLLRGGPLGALAAWSAFTLPSALLLMLFAMGAGAFGGPLGAGLIHGLKIIAVAVVAQAVWGMARALTPDRERVKIALAAVLIVVFLAGSAGQVAAIIVGGLAGLWLCRKAEAVPPNHLTFPVSRAAGWVALTTFLALLALLPLASSVSGAHGVALFDSFYRAGALVFGGGHVVLPLLDSAVVRPGWIGPDSFLAGYGAAQAIPGPLFTFAAYLGAAMRPEPNGFAGAAICLVAIFLPGLLLVTGALPFWNAFRTRPMAQAAMRGTNAAVVGILAAALYTPVWTSAILNARHFATALVGFVLLTVWKVPAWIVVILLALSGIALAFV
jgi:chromate transporter